MATSLAASMWNPGVCHEHAGSTVGQVVDSVRWVCAVRLVVAVVGLLRPVSVVVVVRSWIERGRRAVGCWVAAAPGTHIYLSILLVTTETVRSLHPVLAGELLRQVSTNLTQMGRSSVRVLLLSGFLLDGGRWITQLGLFSVVYVPLERWIGSWRWLSVVAAGHVGATLVTTVGIWADVRANRGAIQLTRSIDVGVSYGLFAATAFASFGVRQRWSRLVLRLGIVTLLVTRLATHRTFSDVGHLAAAAIGAAMYLVFEPGLTGQRAVSKSGLSWRLRPTPDGPVTAGSAR